MLTDSFGRNLDYLRVSVTDRCNLRCVYCMPSEGVKWKPHDSMLTLEEILRLCRIMAELGIRKIKVTGGEPLVRRGVFPFFNKLKILPGIEKVTLTTNGLLLGPFLDFALDDAESAWGFPFNCINVSLDALDEGRYRRITGNAVSSSGTASSLGILSSIDRLLGIDVQVKINCVPVRGLNEEEIIPLATLARDRDISVRFIELMPLGSASNLEAVPGSETLAVIEKAFGRLTPFHGVKGNGPAVYYSLPGFSGKIGFINPVSQGFCDACNRLRLTSEGKLKTCLSSDMNTDLRALLRSNASDAGIAAAISEAALKKPRFHTLSSKRHVDGMSGIGG